MVSRLGLFTIGVLSAAVLTACTPDPDPKPEPTRPTTTVTTPRDSPPVREPLDSKEFAADPCTSLTTAQLAELKLGDGRTNTSNDAYASDDSCVYRDPDSATSLIVYVSYYPEITNGLEHVYDESPPTPSPTRKATVIDGYPAVVRSPKDDRTRCHVDVGTSDTAYFNVTYYYYDWDDWDGRDTCAAATSVAAAVLTTIKAAN